MAVKGDKAHLEPQAMRMYADGQSLTTISAALGVSTTTLSIWKAESKVPSADIDEWDRARLQKRSNTQRLRDLYEDQLEFVEKLSARERSAPMVDALSKIGSLLERWDKLEKASQVAESVVKEVKKSGLSPETVEDIRRQILGIGQ